MTTTPTELDELKAGLTASINTIDDADLLRTLRDVVHSHQTTSDEDWDRLSDYRKARLVEGLSQAHRGEGVSRENAPRDVWLLQP